MRRVILALLTLAAVAGAFSAFVVVDSAFAGYGYEISADEGHWPDSAEFSQLLTGQARFSTHESGLEGLLVLVDHRTGVQYLVTATGACPLLDVDGSPLRVLEAGDDGE